MRCPTGRNTGSQEGRPRFGSCRGKCSRRSVLTSSRGGALTQGHTRKRSVNQTGNLCLYFRSEFLSAGVQNVMWARLLKGAIILAAFSTLAACASLGGKGDAPISVPVVTDPAPIVSGTMRPYQVRGRWYHPR